MSVVVTRVGIRGVLYPVCQRGSGRIAIGCFTLWMTLQACTSGDEHAKRVGALDASSETSSASGGSPNTSGSGGIGAAGTSNSGGVQDTGGTAGTSSGGSQNTGATSSGGSQNTGGTSSGGVAGAGGTGNGGGTTASTGGTNGSGGSVGTGGVAGTGGILGTGGVPGTGGSTNSSDAACFATSMMPESVVVTSVDAGVWVSTILPCEWLIPLGDWTLDRTRLNVVIGIDSGPLQTIGHLSSQADCSGDGWYYNDEASVQNPIDAGADANSDASVDAGAVALPTIIIACPATCDAIKSAATARVEVEFGCPTISGQ